MMSYPEESTKPYSQEIILQCIIMWHLVFLSIFTSFVWLSFGGETGPYILLSLSLLQIELVLINMFEYKRQVKLEKAWNVYYNSIPEWNYYYLMLEQSSFDKLKINWESEGF